MVDATEGWNYTQAVETAHALQEAGAGGSRPDRDQIIAAIEDRDIRNAGYRW